MAGAVRAVDRNALGVEALVLDAQPLVAFVDGELGAQLIESLLDRARAGERRLLMAVINAAEVMIVQERRGGAAASHRTLELLQALPIELVTIDLELTARAAYFKVRGGISLADCFAAALAQREGLPVLTGDREFERVADSIEVLWFGGD
jgi:predicted nucleic acid-binding protein